MADANEYKCPCCGAKLEFNSTAQKMKCPYCDSEFDVETVQDYNTFIRMFPTNLIAKLFGFDKKPYFEASEGAEKAPDVKELFQ